MSLDHLPGEVVMSAEAMVDAAMASFDQGEWITIPSLPNIADWDAYESARKTMMPNLPLQVPAARYGVGTGINASAA